MTGSFRPARPPSSLFAAWTGTSTRIVFQSVTIDPLKFPTYELGVAPGTRVAALADLRGKKIAYSAGQAPGALVLRVLLAIWTIGSTTGAISPAVLTAPWDGDGVPGAVDRPRPARQRPRLAAAGRAGPGLRGALEG